MKCSLPIAAILLIGSASGCGDDESGGTHSGHGGSGTQASCGAGPLHLGDTATSDDGTFTVELVEADPMPSEKFENDWTVRILTADGEPFTSMESLEVTPWMPDHAHDGQVPPELGEMDDTGTLQVDRINLWMAGLWDVYFDVTHDGVQERATLSLCIED